MPLSIKSVHCKTNDFKVCTQKIATLVSDCITISVSQSRVVNFKLSIYFGGSQGSKLSVAYEY